MTQTLLQAGPYETNPILCQFHELVAALAPLHLHDPAHVARLHDLWRMGVVTPESHIDGEGYRQKGFDERTPQAHARVRRLVLPRQLAQWLVEVSAARGMPMTPAQAMNIALGKADYGLGVLEG
ncbi:MAG: hypothetical protein UZ13_03879 [Chloroflexi bacterium OLB13]|jgi:hypothetical protein|nr:MAG: hypothetical protein UZ13_03879 [Chloroflexi bacterium OLB13]